MSTFEDVIKKVRKNLVMGPIGAADMNAGNEFIQEPDKHYGRERYEDDEELDKSVVPQHYLPQYGRVRLLYKALPAFGAVIKADDVVKDEYTDRDIVVAGYASPQVIDREKHLIQKEGMVKDLPRFLANPMFANAMILHSNVQVGVVLTKWTHPETGKVYKTNVDDIGLFVLIKIRTDKFRPKIVDKVIEDIEKGNLKAFSISGDAPVESREHKCTDGQCFWVIPSIEFYEITICEEGVNQDAKLMILSKATQDCPDGLCGLIRKQPVPEGVDVFDEPNPIPKDTIVKDGIRALGEKIGIDWDTALFSEEEFARGIRVEMEHQDVTRGDPVMTAKIAWAHLKELPDYYQRLAEMEGEPKEDKDAEETKESLTERVGEVAEAVGEAEAIEMVENAEEAAKKLEKVNTGSGLGSGGSGDANTMADFGKPYSRETAMKGGDPLIDHFFQAYRTFLARGASPEDAYFKLLDEGADGQPAPPWFGTRDGKFRQFLVQANRSGLPIPTVRLRVIGNREGEIAADPSLTAWDLLQTAMNRMRGMVDKDVSPMEHDNHEKDCEREEAEQSERYYLNLALKTINKSDSTLGAIAESRIHEAYTVAMDSIYRLGHLTQDQRIDLSSAITAALKAFHKEIGDMGDLDIPAEDVALLMKAEDGAVEALSRKFHEVYQREAKRQGDVRHEDRYEDLSEDVKEFDRVLARYVLDALAKHRDRFGSTAHHKTGQPQGGIAQPPQPAPTGQQNVPEQRYKTLLALVRERNQQGAKLRLNPGMRNKPYSVTGFDVLKRPVRLVGNVDEVTRALAENAQEVDEIIEGRKMDNYAVPVEVGVQDVRIYEGDDVDPMEMVREQVAAASFESAVAKVMKHHTGIRGRDFLMDEKQQVEPENVAVMGGIRDSQTGHANTQIISETDVQDIAGVGQEFEQAPEGHGIAQQGSVHPPRGVQGDGRRPEFVQGHEEEHEMRVENEGMPLAPNADDDSRGAPVAGNRGRVHHRSQRP